MAWYDWLIGGGDNPVPGIGSLRGSGKKGSASDGGQTWDEIINQYSYKPQYTAQTEKGLYDLFQQTTGLGGGGVEAIPFDIGLPTTGLYDALTRGIKEQYLGTPGGPEGGRIADTRAYYNNMGIPEYAQNQERLANQDLNNSLLDTAAEINNNQKDRLLNVLGLGANVGSNLYSQDLAQQRFNTGIAATGQQFDAGLNQAINSANQSSLSSLLAGAGALGTTLYTGNPMAGQAAGTGINYLTGQTNPNVPNAVNQLGGTNSLFGSGSNYGSSNDPYSGLSKLIK
jgi:hypothetical protein